MLGPVQAAFFDLDKTVIAQASMVAFGKPLYRNGLISRTTVLRSLYAQLVYMHLGASEEKLQRIRESVLALTRGWEQERVRQIVREALEEVVEPIVFREALDLIAHHKAEGHKVFIVSASPEEIVLPLGRYLGVDESIASRAEIDDEGRYTGEMDVYAYGPWKAEIMKSRAESEGIDLSASWAYSDSITDAPMLATVGHPVAVNPDRDLARLAREKGWEIRHFEKPVRLRDRVPVPPKGPTIAAGGVAAAAGAAALIWWRLRPAAPPPTRIERLSAATRRSPAASWMRRLRG
jgi:HAD superfamily hydrolase (TIGR01490 family)